MKNVLKVAAWSVLGLAVLLGLTWALMGNEFVLYRYFAPRHEAVRREVFEQSKAYRQGMIQELQGRQAAYAQADPAHRDALASVILHEVADYDVTSLPPYLQDFIAELRREQVRR